MSKHRHIVGVYLMLVFCALSGCATEATFPKGNGAGAQSVKFTSVGLYEGITSIKNYTVLGTVTANCRIASLGSAHAQLERDCCDRLKEAAANLGADALLNVQLRPESTSWLELSGLAVRLRR